MQQEHKKYLTLGLVLLVTALAGIGGFNYLRDKREAFLQSYEQKKAADQAKEAATEQTP